MNQEDKDGKFSAGGSSGEYESNRIEPDDGQEHETLQKKVGDDEVERGIPQNLSSKKKTNVGKVFVFGGIVLAVLLECKVCHSALLGISELIQTGENDWEWDSASRLWPTPETEIDWDIPEIARNSLIEAKICFKAKAFSACAVMCGRSIEGVCKHHAPEIKTLAGGLKKLREGGIIDERIYEWGEALRENRNLGAHATTEKVSKEDARDLLDFSVAICEYVFILNAKWERFQNRRVKS